jgi:arabinofuranosyltransferase
LTVADGSSVDSGARSRAPAHRAVERWARRALALAVVALALVGWRELYFLTDDAYIAFRYVANGMLGRGLVWNPPPFAPVEGYTSFLWVALLGLVWWATGSEPPAVANALACAFSLLLLALVWRWIARLALPPKLERWRLAILALVVVGLAANRTFLTWSSSGLETALFALLFVAWVREAMRMPGRRGTWWLPGLSTIAALSALARPDGLLLALATPVLAAVDAVQRPRAGGWRKEPLLLAPLLLVVVHLLWRRSVYGLWLPNTYYAKQGGGWAEAGLRYLGAFILEYAWWTVLALAIVATAARLASRNRSAPAWWAERAQAVVVLGVVLAHLGFYVVWIGGDHFEYRVFAHLVPLLLIAAAALAADAFGRRPLVALAALFMVVLGSLPLPWVAWREESRFTTREETRARVPRIAERLPQPLRLVARAWEAQLAWLLPRGVGVRQPEHAAFERHMRELLPSRREGGRLGWDEMASDRPVAVMNSVGVGGWVLPHVAILDARGLNDRVVARHLRDDGRRYLAHDRRPPPGYVECFRPNVVPRMALARPREQPLGDPEIRGCEAAWWPPPTRR